MSDSDESTPTSGVCIVRQSDDGREVLVARRPPDSGFLPGFHGFVVGRIQHSDGDLPFAPGGPFREPSREHWGCAVRELFEETGLLPLKEGWISSWDPEPDIECPWGDWAEFRRHVCEGEIDFAAALDDASFQVDAHRFHPVGHWTTPEWADLDTTTEFFVVEAPAELTSAVSDHIDPAEHLDPQWVAPEMVVERWRRGEWFVSTPIRLVFEGIARMGELEDRDLLPPASQRGRSSREMIEILGGIRMLPLATPTLPPATHTNCYIIGDNRLVLVDPGSDLARECQLLTEALESLIRARCFPDAVIVTHHHRDHVGGVTSLTDRFDIEVWAHEETAIHMPPELAVDRFLEDGEKIALDGEDAPVLEVLHTPGHAPGHVCLYEHQTRVLFAGDLVASKGTILIDPDDGNMGEYLASLERVDDLELRAILPAHGTVIADPHRVLRHYVDHRNDREEMVAQALASKSGPAAPDELVPEVYTDVPTTAWPLAVRSLHSHLIHLVELGRARKVDRGFVYDSSSDSST